MFKTIKVHTKKPRNDLTERDELGEDEPVVDHLYVGRRGKGACKKYKTGCHQIKKNPVIA